MCRIFIYALDLPKLIVYDDFFLTLKNCDRLALCTRNFWFSLAFCKLASANFNPCIKAPGYSLTGCSGFGMEFSLGKTLQNLSLNLLPNKPWFLVSAVQVFRKHWEKEKLLITCNFSFSHSVFHSFGDPSAISIRKGIVVCKLFLFGIKCLKFVVWERVKHFVRLGMYMYAFPVIIDWNNVESSVKNQSIKLSA